MRVTKMQSLRLLFILLIYISSSCLSSKEFSTRSHEANFKYDKEKNNYICPEGKILDWQGTVEMDGRTKEKYSGEKVCSDCENKEQCTKADVRIIMRDSNEEVKDRMREKLSKEENKELYDQRAHPCESPYGIVKYNWKY